MDGVREKSRGMAMPWRTSTARTEERWRTSKMIVGCMPVPAAACRVRSLSWASRMRMGSPMRTTSSQSRVEGVGLRAGGSAAGARGGSGAPTMEVGLSRGSREGYDEQGGEGGQCPGSRARRGESRLENRGSWALGGRRVGDAEKGRRMPGAVLVRRPHGDEGSPWEEEWRRRKRGRKIREMIRRNRIREIQDPSAR